MGQVEKFFRPEFINRLDDVIVFRPLNREDLTSIIDFELTKVRERLEMRGLSLELDDAAKEFLMDKGYNPDYGARPLRRAIGSFIEDPLAESLLSAEYLEGQTHRGDPQGRSRSLVLHRHRRTHQGTRVQRRAQA